MAKTIYFRNFNGTDTLASLELAMKYLQSNPGSTLVIEPGTYILTSPLARETQRAVMAGEYGSNPQRTMFSPSFEYTRGMCFSGQRDTRVEAYGVTFLVDGFMEPISMRDCENVTLCGITIDHVRKPYSRGIIRDVVSLNEEGSTKSGTVVFDADCPNEPNSPRHLRHKFYDAELERELIAYVESGEYIDPHHIRYTFSSAEKLHDGVEFYTAHTYHSRPAILIENAKNITLEDVIIHSQPGMGVVGNRSENVTLRRLSVVPSLGHHYSTNTDGTHFTSMKGLLRIENCTFEYQGDDFVNVHNYYHKIISRESDNICCMQEKTPDGTHAQSLDYPDVGDFLELTSRQTMELIDTFRVVSCTPIESEWMCRVELDHALPECTEELVLADVTRLPRLEVVGCHALCHHARSILIKTRSVLIEGNTFRDVRGSAIHVAPEAHWYEGVSPADVTIRANRIIRCAETWQGERSAGIMVYADSEKPDACPIKNIVIEDNIIECPHTSHGISVRNVDGLRIARNRIISSNDPIAVETCKNTSIE